MAEMQVICRRLLRGTPIGDAFLVVATAVDPDDGLAHIYSTLMPVSQMNEWQRFEVRPTREEATP